MNLIGYLLTQRKVERYKTFVLRERVAVSFLNFVPDLEVPITVVFAELWDVAKLHLFDKEINDNRDYNL